MPRRICLPRTRPRYESKRQNLTDVGANLGILIGLIGDIMLVIMTAYAMNWFRAANKHDLKNLAGVLAPFSALVAFICGGTWAASSLLQPFEPERVASYFQFLVYCMGPILFVCLMWAAFIVYTDYDNAAARADIHA